LFVSYKKVNWRKANLEMCVFISWQLAHTK
jgi:hypothetical protein